jgi:hypothetical protein
MIETESQLKEWFVNTQVDRSATELSFKTWERCLEEWSIGKCYAFAMCSVSWLDSSEIGWGALRCYSDS